MTTDMLAGLGLALPHVERLDSQSRTRLLAFLLRWKHLDALQACLDILIPANPTLVSLLDLRVEAWVAEGRPADALPVMQARLRLRDSLTAQMLLGQVYLAQGDLDRAHRVAKTLVQEQESSTVAWGFLGQVELARNDVEAALDAYRRINEQRPQSRAYLLGMVRIYQARGEWVTASSYAVRVLQSVDQENPLPVQYLSQLRDYFQAAGEKAHVADLEAELEQRYGQELNELQAALAPYLRVPTATPAPAGRYGATAQIGRPRAEAEIVGDLTLPAAQVDVSDEERATITEATRRLFGFDKLLPGQLETLACVLRGEDVLTILPTGGGKSLCYQLPAMLAEQGTILVISPLIALMKDQIDSLPFPLQRQATTINSSLEGDELRRRLERIGEGGYRLVYAAPERLRQPTFLHAMRRSGLSRLVIDEAHCVSVWGHDFRPDYLAIGQARQALGDPPVLALTATAPSPVRRDIIVHLSGAAASSQSRFRVIAGDVTRPNLQLEVFYARNADDKLRCLLSQCQALTGSGIVYVDTRDRCEALAAMLRQHGLSADHYHAGISDRDRAQEDFMCGRTRIVVATIAFGLGIDKPDIRFIIHFGPPASLEAYYQEAGRAGRDGQPARCLLMYSPSDQGIMTRRARRELLSVEFLRAVYASVKGQLGNGTAGRANMPDLERQLQQDDTCVRVALALLERAGLLRRGPDVPRAALLCLADGDMDAAPPGLLRFCQAARLRVRQPLTLDPVATAQQAGLPLDRMERSLLEWADAGWLDYRPSGRDLLLELLPPPSDAGQRIQMLLEQYETAQLQRIEEMVNYVRTGRCRHGHINAYLGGRLIEQCAACDNCVGGQTPQAAGLPDEREQLLTILRCASAEPWSIGRQTLVRVLRGEGKGHTGTRNLDAKYRENAFWGSLAFRSTDALTRLLDRLESGGFLQARSLEHGGVVLDLTKVGRRALEDPTFLQGLVTPEPKQAAPPASPTPRDETRSDGDEALFQSLRAWRLEQARAQQVPPYIVLHDSHLRALVTVRPLTLEALVEVEGIGPKRAARYGNELIEIIRAHQPGKGQE